MEIKHQHNSLAKSFDYCTNFTRKTAGNFYYGIKLLPKKKQKALCAIYTWMRVVDDIVDNTTNSKEKTTALAAFQQNSIALLNSDNTSDTPQLDKFWLAWRETVRCYQIPTDYFLSMLNGQQQDISQHQYNTFQELYDYCYCVASTVGLICIKIWGYEGDKDTQQLAEWHGIALQLTNILRDIRMDANTNRVYLPAEFSGNVALKPEDILHGSNEIILPAIKKMIKKTDDYYLKSAPLEKRISADCIRCFKGMTEIYYNIFLKIKRNPSAVLKKKKVRLNLLTKLGIILRLSNVL